jgi:hypothetical protein
MAQSAPREKNHRAGIFARVWDEAFGRFTPQMVRQVLKLGFSDADKWRMHELAKKNSEGRISSDELAELDEFILLGTSLPFFMPRLASS